MNIYKVAFAVHYIVDHKLFENQGTGNKTCESSVDNQQQTQIIIYSSAANNCLSSERSDPNGLMSVQILPVIRPLCPNILKQIKVTIAVLQSTYLI